MVKNSNMQEDIDFPPPKLVSNIDANGELLLLFQGIWDIGTLSTVSNLLNSTYYKIDVHTVKHIRCNIKDIQKIDSSAFLFLDKFLKKIEALTIPFTLEASTDMNVLYETISSKKIFTPKEKHTIPFFITFLANIGKWLEYQIHFYTKMLAFFGYLLSEFMKGLLSPRKLHWTPIFYHMEHMGIRAIPIIALLSFLVGMVLAYMSAGPFQRFGAQIYVVNLLEIAVLRELGVLLTSIIVAGRTGASCTAEIGSMVSNEEVASMQVMGLNPMEYLVIPRVLALMLMLPVLTLISDASALIGGMLASWFSLDIIPQSFWSLFKEATTLTTFYLGLAKAPVFALIITGVGCFYGFQSTGSSDEIGRLTTESVVQSLFLVIVFDALFAVLYSKLGL